MGILGKHDAFVHVAVGSLLNHVVQRLTVSFIQVRFPTCGRFGLIEVELTRVLLQYCQMIKAITPVVVLGVSVLFKVKTASGKLVAIVCLISLGVAVASYGEVKFDALGFSVQVSDCINHNNA